MEKDLIINNGPTGVEIALLENGKLVELHHQKTNNNFTVGDIYVAKIRKLMPGLNAAFLDIGSRKDAFLHYTDLGPKLRSLAKYTRGVIGGSINTSSLDNFKFDEDIVKTGKVDQVLNKKNPILVQILKEPISTKGPRLSCEITIPGRYMVLAPMASNMDVSVSKKISSNEERRRLQKLAVSIRPKHFGLIIRTAAEGKKVNELHDELVHLMAKWEEIFKQLKNKTAPAKLLSELDKPASILRDLLTDSFTNIVVNEGELFAGIKGYLKTIAPDQLNILKFHKGKRPIFDQYGVTRQVKSSFGKTATMASGSYIVIEKTEAMHVIDVNSGHKVSTTDTEKAITAVNVESAKEIARQLRLRDIGGLITIDFIDMRNVENKKLLYRTMVDAMKGDRAQHTVLPLSKFGLMSITRERTRPALSIDTTETCPSCQGSGKVNSTILITDSVDRDLEFIVRSLPKSKITLRVHPYLEAYLKKGLPSWQHRAFMKYRKWITIEPRTDFQIMDYRFYDVNNDEIRLN